MAYAERFIIGIFLFVSAYEIYGSASQRYHFHLLISWSNCKLNYSLQSPSYNLGKLLMARDLSKGIDCLCVYECSGFNGGFGS
jgi:uncharacterized protein (DUF486 family)